MPLTTKELTEIKANITRAEKALKDAKADIATAKRAGIDMVEAEKELRETETKLRRMKAVYY